MPLEDEDFPDDETLKKQNYEEFRLNSVQEHNLKEIEQSLKNKKVNGDNKKDILDYLQDLYTELSIIKKDEYQYEGEQNFNINRELQRIKKLIETVEKI
jgi:hypothetical protein